MERSEKHSEPLLTARSDVVSGEGILPHSVVKSALPRAKTPEKGLDLRQWKVSCFQLLELAVDLGQLSATW